MAVTWNANYELTPLPQDSPTGIDDECRALKDSISVRMSNEHETFETDNSSGTEGEDFVHKAGSAKVYYQATAPTLRPDGVTALDSEDAGRKWVDSDDDKSYTWSGAEWVEDENKAEYGVLIDADSPVTPDEVIKYKRYTLTMANGSLTASVAHGISDAYTNNRIVSMSIIVEVSAFGLASSYDGATIYPSTNYVNNTYIFCSRGNSTGTYTYYVLLGYI